MSLFPSDNPIIPIIPIIISSYLLLYYSKLAAAWVCVNYFCIRPGRVWEVAGCLGIGCSAFWKTQFSFSKFIFVQAGLAQWHANSETPLCIAHSLPAVHAPTLRCAAAGNYAAGKIGITKLKTNKTVWPQMLIEAVGFTVEVHSKVLDLTMYQRWSYYGVDKQKHIWL